MKVPKLNSAKFTYQNHAGAHHLFLWKADPEPPFVKVEAGWKIVGTGDAPWPGNSNGHAVMLEKTEACEDYEEGYQIWQHLSSHILEEMP